MTAYQKNKPVKGAPAVKPLPGKDAPPPTGTHSQDADRKRNIRHPHSEK